MNREVAIQTTSKTHAQNARISLGKFLFVSFFLSLFLYSWHSHTGRSLKRPRFQGMKLCRRLGSLRTVACRSPHLGKRRTLAGQRVKAERSGRERAVLCVPRRAAHKGFSIETRCASQVFPQHPRSWTLKASHFFKCKAPPLVKTSIRCSCSSTSSDQPPSV